MEQRDDTQDLMEIAAAVFHGRVVSMDANGNYNAVGYNGQAISGALTARPYGLRSYAPANTGLVLAESQAGLLVLSQEGALPSGVSEPLSGETILYNSQGARVHLDTNGDIIHEPKSGRYIKLGSGAAKKVGLDGDPCPGTEAMNTWMGQVETGISGAGGTPPSPVASSFNESAIANLSASATKVMGE